MTTMTTTQRKENVKAINGAQVRIISIDDMLNEHQAQATTLSGVFKFQSTHPRGVRLSKL